MRPSSSKKVSALADEIVERCKRGVLCAPFGMADIRKHFGAHYADSHIRTVLPNYCETTGYWAKRGYRPRFKKVGWGKYDIL